jgi:protein-tyrosine phosphatase
MSELKNVIDTRNEAQRSKWASQVFGEWYFLGSAKDAKNLDALRSHGITHVLNVSDDVPNYYEDTQRNIAYRKLNVKDFGSDSGIARVFPDAFQFIISAKANGGKILVHCMAGQNRSVTVTVAFVMYFEKKSLRESFEFVRIVRKNVCPFRDNREQLVHYEKLLQGTSTMDVDDFVVSYRPPVAKPAQAEASVHRSCSEDNLIASPSSSFSKVKKSSKGIPPEFLTSSMSSLPGYSSSGSSSSSSEPAGGQSSSETESEAKIGYSSSEDSSSGGINLRSCNRNIPRDAANARRENALRRNELSRSSSQEDDGDKFRSLIATI